jgi:hypothetical protein
MGGGSTGFRAVQRSVPNVFFILKADHQILTLFLRLWSYHRLLWVLPDVEFHNVSACHFDQLCRRCLGVNAEDREDAGMQFLLPRQHLVRALSVVASIGHVPSSIRKEPLPAAAQREVVPELRCRVFVPCVVASRVGSQ